jgi:hypothetical protein
MSAFNFIIAKFIPDLVKNEPVNIGVIVNDPVSKKSYGRFIENFRTLSMRYPDANINALKLLLDSYRGEHAIPDPKYLEKLSSNSVFQLRFTEPNAIRAGLPSQALELLFSKYISIEPKNRPRQALTKIQLYGMVTKVIQLEEFRDEWVEKRPKIQGKIGHFTFDYGFKNGKINDLIHTISFTGKSVSAYRDSKALAISVEDALTKNEELTCTAIVHPPSDQKTYKEYYQPAIGYLQDKKCIVKDEDGIEQALKKIKEKLLVH